MQYHVKRRNKRSHAWGRAQANGPLPEAEAQDAQCCGRDNPPTEQSAPFNLWEGFRKTASTKARVSCPWAELVQRSVAFTGDVVAPYLCSRAVHKEGREILLSR